MIYFLLLLLLAGCAVSSSPNATTITSPTKVVLTTSDGKTIAGSYYSGISRTGGIIFLHMLNKDRHTYDSLARKLNKAGLSVIAIDLRGHGESSGIWREFTDIDFVRMILDVKAAKQYLLQQKVDANNIGIVGASIGANLALRLGVEDASIKYIVLLSPGLDYRGVKTDDVIHQYMGGLLLVASKEDTYSSSTVQKLYDASVSKDKEIKLYDKLGHGTDIFIANPDTEQFVVNWVLTRKKII